MKNLADELIKFKGKTLVAVFPHPDDESYAVGGLFQTAKKIGIKVKLICFTQGNQKGPKMELRKALKILGTSDFLHLNFREGDLSQEKGWKNVLKREITKSRPSLIVTFDNSGITGHPDHLIVTKELSEVIRNLKRKPELYWRVPDKNERRLFRNSPAMKYAEPPTHILSYGLSESVNKIRAIFCYRKRAQKLAYKLHIIDWLLFCHQEYYYRVDFTKRLVYKIVRK